MDSLSRPVGEKLSVAGVLPTRNDRRSGPGLVDDGVSSEEKECGNRAA